MLDDSQDLCYELVARVASAREAGGSVEKAVLDFINTHQLAFGLHRALHMDDVAAISEQFRVHYYEIKDSPHFDEFFILDTENKGNFVTHQGSICVSFAKFVNSDLLDVPQELTQPLEQARLQAEQLGPTIPHKNDLANNEVEVKTEKLNTNELQALFERIDSYSDPQLKETLQAQLKKERPDFKPKINFKAFLQHIAYGQQDEAEALLKRYPILAQELLTAQDIEFTDYSGCTFACTAYEYAWWAKDSRMRFMLEKYMDDDTKQTLLKRIQQIEAPLKSNTLFKRPGGLHYTQNGKQYCSSHVDLQPLKQALQDFIEAYKQNPKVTEEDWETLSTIWIKVGLPQREIPAHIAPEFLHPQFEDLSTDPGLLDASKPENKLQRSLLFYNYLICSFDVWFTPFPLLLRVVLVWALRLQWRTATRLDGGK